LTDRTGVDCACEVANRRPSSVAMRLIKPLTIIIVIIINYSLI